MSHQWAQNDNHAIFLFPSLEHVRQLICSIGPRHTQLTTVCLKTWYWLCNSLVIISMHETLISPWPAIAYHVSCSQHDCHPLSLRTQPHNHCCSFWSSYETVPSMFLLVEHRKAKLATHADKALRRCSQVQLFVAILQLLQHAWYQYCSELVKDFLVWPSVSAMSTACLSNDSNNIATF